MRLPSRRLLAVMACLGVAGCDSSRPAVTISDASSAEAVGLVDIAQRIPDVALEIRYAGADNFVGAPIDGYEASRCYLVAQPAAALERVERALREENMRLWVRGAGLGLLNFALMLQSKLAEGRGIAIEEASDFGEGDDALFDGLVEDLQSNWREHASR